MKKEVGKRRRKGGEQREKNVSVCERMLPDVNYCMIHTCVRVHIHTCVRGTHVCTKFLEEIF